MVGQDQSSRRAEGDGQEERDTSEEQVHEGDAMEGYILIE